LQVSDRETLRRGTGRGFGKSTQFTAACSMGEFTHGVRDRSDQLVCVRVGRGCRARWNVELVEDLAHVTVDRFLAQE
jgi:hypothetical protein